MATKKPSALQIEAAKRVDRNYIMGKEDPRYQRNMTGAGSGKFLDTPSSEPMRKIANARSIARDADRADYLKEMAKRKK